MELSDLGNSAVVRRAIGRGKLQTVRKGCVDSIQPSQVPVHTHTWFPNL